MCCTELDQDEQPERLLIVKDGEVTVEKYYSPEERKKMEETVRLEEERRKAELVSPNGKIITSNDII